MNAATSTRKTADVRREEILVVALEEFGEHGLDGTSTDTIARKAGISQPYLFRLFGTKKELYLETVRRCLIQTLELFQEAAEGKRGEEALKAIGQAYRGLLADRTRLRAQMQAYADCDDDEVREVVREGYGRLVDYIERVSGAEPERIRDFFAFGMLLNVFAPVANVVLSSVRPEEEGQASGANNAIRELGGVFGVAVLASVFAHYGGYRTGQTFVDGLAPAIYVGAGFVAAGAVAALGIARKVRRQEQEAPAAVLAAE